MAINDPNKQEGVRKPRASVELNGQSIPGLVEVEVVNNSLYQADHFTAHFALWYDDSHGPDWWGQQTDMLLDIKFSLDDGASYTSMMKGNVDHLILAPESGIVTVDGRDLSSLLIDTKTVEAYRNKTSSEIAQALASKHSLTADIQNTTTKVGRFYDDDHDRIQHDQFSTAHTEWDLLVMLAHREGFDCWVTGNTLHFKPGPDINGNPYEVVWQKDGRVPRSNVNDLRLERALTLAKDVVVAVRSYNSSKKTGFTMYAPSGFRQAAIQSGKAQMFTFSRPNMDHEQAQEEANRLRTEISKHEKLINFKRPSDLTLSTQNIIQLRGLGGSWDQTYFINSVTRTLNERSFVMEVSGKNHSPESNAAIS